MGEYPPVAIAVSDIHDKWLAALAEECKAQNIAFEAKRRTTPTWGAQCFLEIPRLRATVGGMLPSFMPGLLLSPYEDPWNMVEAIPSAYGPRDLAEMLIRKRLGTVEPDNAAASGATTG
jgi:hypothetical protein